MSALPLEHYLLTAPRGAMSRIRMVLYRALGLHAGRGNRLERVRCRRLSQIQLGDLNALSEGCWLWPENTPSTIPRILIGNRNYFNRDVMIEACGRVEIGDDNMFGPWVYITDSNHQFDGAHAPGELPMSIGRVRIGNLCWIGAKAVILRNVELGDGCVVGAGSVVTKSFPAGSVLAGVPARLLRSVG